MSVGGVIGATSAEIKLLGAPYAHYSLLNNNGLFSIAQTSGNVALGATPTNVLNITYGNNVGIGKTNPSCSLDVSGSVSATSIATGGSTAKQFDCGSGSYGPGTVISFNFTFSNTPTVFISSTGNQSTSYYFGFNPYSITKTGFTLASIYFTTNSSTINYNSAVGLCWFAFG